MKTLLWIVAGVAAIQLVPFGHSHINPPAGREPKWDSPGTRELVHRACFNCHSNETTWPWYSNVAPVSWLVQRDVNDGRRHLNFTEMDAPQRHLSDVAKEVASGDMPPWFYLPMHPEARMNDTEKQALIQGAGASLGPQK